MYKNIGSYKHRLSFGFIAVIVFFSFFVIKSATAAPIIITIRDYVDYNVTYNSTDEKEYPDESPENNGLRLPLVNGTIRIYNNASEKLFNINVTINNTEKLYRDPSGQPVIGLYTAESEVNGFVHGKDKWDEFSGGILILSVPDLPVGKSAVFYYRVNTSEVDVYEPVNITARVYTDIEQGRVFNNEDFNLTLIVSNRFAATNITLNATQIAMNNFTFNNNTGFMGMSEGGNLTIDNMTIIWQNVTLEYLNDTAIFNLTVHSPNTTSGGEYVGDSYNQRKNWKSIIFARLELQFLANNTIWPVNITSVEARSEADIVVTKERTSAFNWTARPKFRNPTNDLYYELRRFTIWATVSDRNFDTGINGLPDPGAPHIPDSDYEWNESNILPQYIGFGETWNEDDSIFYMFRNETDSVVPMFWGIANFTIVDNASMVGRYWRSQNRTGIGKYVYYQKIIILNGYFLEATKQVRTTFPNGTYLPEGVYFINITLKNRGSGVTPNSTLLADIIPRNFNLTFDIGSLYVEEGNMTINSSNPTKTNDLGPNSILWAKYGGVYNFSGKSQASGDYAGSWTYFWELKPLEVGEVITITYYMNGSGEFRSSELFMIGVDPVQTNRLASSRKIFSFDGFQRPGSMAEDIAVPLSLGIFIISVFTFKRKKTPELIIYE